MGPTRMNPTVSRARRLAACQLAALILVLSCQGPEEPQRSASQTSREEIALSGGDVGHAAVLLHDGTILVAGGNDQDGQPVRGARLYDPATDTESPVGALTAARSHASMTLLLDGRVLVTGGTGGAAELGSLEIFDPQTGTFSVLPSHLDHPRQGHFATAMTDGHVLIKGGSEHGTAITIAELFDSADETVGPVGGSLDGVRLASVATERGDYSPFEHARVTGGGWQPGETVALLFDETPFTHWPQVIHVTADENGAIDNQDFALEPHDLGTSFVLTATGLSSGWTAQTTFTDSTTLTYAPATQAVAADAGGVVGSFVQTVTAPGGSGNFTTTLLVEGTGANPIPASWVTANPTSVSFSAVFATISHPWTLTFSVPSGTPTGVYTADVKALASSSAVLSGTGTAVSLTVNTSDGVPVPDAHGPYTVGEQGTVVLNGTARDADDTVLTFTWDLDGNGSFETSGAAPTFSAAGRDGPTAQIVTLKVCDPGLHCATTTAQITITNVPPTATFTVAPMTVNEGSSFTLTMSGATDVAPADVAAGFTYAFDCGAGYAPVSAATSVTCATTDNVVLSVGGKVFDKNGGFTETRGTVSVLNVAPTATFVAPASVPEGSAINLALTNATDVGPNDISTLRFAFDCGTGTFGPLSATTTASCPTTDNGTRVVRGQVRDKNNGFTNYEATVIVTNVAPAATIANGGPVPEATPVTVTVSGATDPSSADTTAGFHYAFACDGGSLAGATYATSGTAAQTSCLYPDNGAYTVRARVLDKDNGASEMTTVVTVTNVAPTASLQAPAAGTEGTAFTLTLSAPIDPSSVDIAAGFLYAFDCGGGAGYGPASSSPSGSCVPADNGTFAVRGKITDKDGGASEYGASVVVANAAPTATAANNGPVGEGSAATVTVTATDPSSADVAAGLHYAFACDGGSLDGATYASTGAAPTTSCTYDDQGSYTVRVRVIDKDGDAGEATTVVTVTDVAPTATFAAPETVNEGTAFTLTLTAPVDPSTGDTAAGFTYAFDCGDGAGYHEATGTASATCTTVDSGARTVRGKIIDKDGGATEYQAVVEVVNVAPTATLANDGPIDEGGAVNVHVDGAADPSPVDTAAGFHYAFSCTGGSLAGATYATSGTASATSCAFDDQGTFTVTARIIDKDGGATDLTTIVSVSDVAPTAAFTASSPIVEGGSSGLSFEGAFDPSQADSAAGFRFAYACDGGSLAAATYATASAEPTASCTFDDNGTFTVRGRIIATDDGFTEYTASVVVENAPPAALVTNDGPIDEGGAANVSVLAVIDPSAADTAAGFTYAFACDGVTFGAPGAAAQTSCAFADNGSFTVLVRVTDKDGGASERATVVVVRNVAPTASLSSNGPVDEGGTVTVSFAGASDPSPVDTAAGFHYAFACDGSALDGTTYAGAGASPSIDCTFADDGDHVVVARIIDKDGGSSESSVTVSVRNAAPVITGTTGPEAPVQIGDIVDVSATFTDAGATDGHTCAIDWGDGEVSTGAVASGTCSASHVYAVSGTFTVTITVSDDDGASTSATRTVVVEEEPMGGFAVGGGWFQAPAGSDPSMPGASGRAFFAFVAADTSTTSPVGVTVFLFLRAGLEFSSVMVDTMTVDGATAVYSGHGTVNGQGGYLYTVTAVDGQAQGGGGLDRLRVRIWNAATGATVFDNGAPTPIANGGSIVVQPAP